MKPARRVSRASYDEADLLRRARAAQARAYVPYSHFHVGCCVLTADGQVFEGANVENAAYPLSGCAEQTALRTMAAAGVRSPVVAVAVVGDGEDPCTPCGGCRQVIFEFGPDATVYASGAGGRPLVAHITELLPYAFGPRRLAQALGGHWGDDEALGGHWEDGQALGGHWEDGQALGGPREGGQGLQEDG